MPNPNRRQPLPEGVMDARSFNEMMVSTYKKNLKIRQRKERSEKGK